MRAKQAAAAVVVVAALTGGCSIRGAVTEPSVATTAAEVSDICAASEPRWSETVQIRNGALQVTLPFDTYETGTAPDLCILPATGYPSEDELLAAIEAHPWASGEPFVDTWDGWHLSVELTEDAIVETFTPTS